MTPIVAGLIYMATVVVVFVAAAAIVGRVSPAAREDKDAPGMFATGALIWPVVILVTVICLAGKAAITVAEKFYGLASKLLLPKPKPDPIPGNHYRDGGEP